jgi:hypothetical protein
MLRFDPGDALKSLARNEEIARFARNGSLGQKAPFLLPIVVDSGYREDLNCQMCSFDPYFRRQISLR